MEDVSHDSQQAAQAMAGALTSRADGADRTDRGVLVLVVVEQALELRPRGRPGANHGDPRWDEERAPRGRAEGHSTQSVYENVTFSQRIVTHMSH